MVSRRLNFQGLRPVTSIRPLKLFSFKSARSMSISSSNTSLPTVHVPPKLHGPFELGNFIYQPPEEHLYLNPVEGYGYYPDGRIGGFIEGRRYCIVRKVRSHYISICLLTHISTAGMGKVIDSVSMRVRIFIYLAHNCIYIITCAAT
jgi:hypothetical protein